MMNIAARALSFAILLLILTALPAAATTNPNTQRGFAPDAVYQFNDVDHINVFNGSPTIRIPIGQTYTAGDRLKYALMLTYNSSIWDTQLYATTEGDRVEMIPARTSNAGQGWLLSLGELHVDNFIIYTSPDGAQHPFKDPTLHFGTSIPGDTAVLYTRDGSYLRLRDTSTSTERGYTVDLPDGTSKEFFCSSGCNSLSNLSRFLLRRITDPFGNSVTVVRDPEPQATPLPAGTTWKWNIVEALEGGQETTHTITFEYWPYAPYRWVVRQVDMEVSPSTFVPDNPVTEHRKGTYKFNYVSGGQVYRPPSHTASTQLTQVQTNQLGRIYVPLLESIELPDHSFWHFNYYVATGEDIVASFPGRPYTTARYDGLLNRITYPTGGGVRYEWGTYIFPHRTCIPGDRSFAQASRSDGVRIRQLFDRKGVDSGQPWRYITTSNSAINNQDKIWPYDCEPSTTFRNTIVDPLNNVTVNYFSVFVRGYTNPYGADPTEYGLSLSRQFPDPANTSDTAKNRWLSTRTFQCTTSVPFDFSKTPAGTVRANAAEPANAINPTTGGSACTELRKAYVRFESSGDDCPPFDDDNGPGCVSANRRLASQRTVFVDDGNSWIQTDNSDFDGLGHYRTTRTTSNFYSLNSTEFTGKHAHGDVSVQTTRYNPNAQFNLEAQTYCCFPLPSQRWLLTTYDQTTRSEEKTNPSDNTEQAPFGDPVIAKFVFDDRGFLTKKRALKTASETNQDVVVTYNRVDVGAGRFKIEERYYGGDSGGANTLSNADYAIDKTYRFGSLEREEYKTCDGATTVLLVQRNEVDPATGLILSTRDASGAITSFLYDELGRTTRIQPPGEARSEIQYNNVSSNAAANALIERKDAANTVLATSAVTFDDWGRVAQQRKQLPFGVWNRRTTVFHPNGWIASQSTTGPDDDTSNKGITNILSYDPFGRPLLVQHADDGEVATHTTAFAYRGNRKTTRTVTGVATTTGGNGTTASSELMDAQGRLQAVLEPSQTASVPTVYDYDQAGRLVKVDSGTQTRSWQYDNRGFLNNEKHPEIDAAGITWRDYDALGHAHEKLVGPIGSQRGAFDLSFEYDGAERLRAVTLPDQHDKPLKTWAFYGNNAVGRLVGKLRKTQRFNYVPDSTKPAPAMREIVVSQYFDYYSWNHRISTVRLDGPGVRMLTSYDYDGLGNPKSITYPEMTVGCNASSTCPTVTTSRTVSYQYDNGFVKAVPGYVKSITYNVNELVKRVTLQNDTVWVQDVSDRYLPRPSKLKAEGLSWVYGPYSYDALGNIYAIGSDGYTYDAVSRLQHATGSTSADYQYDRNGNLTSLGVSVDPATNRINATNVTYDIAGNLKHYEDSRDSHKYDYTFDRFNQLTLVTAQSGGLQTLRRASVYDVSDERVAVIDYLAAKPKVTELWSGRDLTGHLLRDALHVWNPAVAETTNNPVSRGWSWKGDYIYRSDALVATADASGTKYVHVDHLGTPRVISNASGVAIDGRTYEPFGVEVNVRPDALRKKFTGHERDDDGTSAQIGDLDYMHARYYGPAIARFLSIDPLVDARQAMHTPQLWNRYAYVRNNPVSYSDPTGKILVLSGSAEEQKKSLADIKNTVPVNLRMFIRTTTQNGRTVIDTRYLNMMRSASSGNFQAIRQIANSPGTVVFNSSHTEVTTKSLGTEQIGVGTSTDGITISAKNSMSGEREVHVAGNLSPLETAKTTAHELRHARRMLVGLPWIDEMGEWTTFAPNGDPIFNIGPIANGPNNMETSAAEAEAAANWDPFGSIQ